MVTLKQVAAEAGVSVSTASAALRGMDIVKPATAKKVHAAAERLNYRTNVSARALRSGHSGIYTLIVPDLDNQFYSRLANSLSYELLEQGRQLIIQVSRYDREAEQRQIRQIDRSACDGLFVCSTHNSGHDILQATGDSYPVIMFDDMSAPVDVHFDSIETPSQAGIHAAIRHLVEDCHRTRVGIVGTFEEHRQGLSATLRQERFESARHALDAYGLDDGHTFIACDWSFEAGVEVAHELAGAGEPPFDALCCMNDELALGVMRGLTECGVNVPGDVAVTGFDGVATGSYTTPTLTTVAVDFTSMAKTAAMMMQDRNDWQASGLKPSPRRVIVGFQLLRRESTLGRTATTGFTTRQ